jgi:hypothetical protein
MPDSSHTYPWRPPVAARVSAAVFSFAKEIALAHSAGRFFHWACPVALLTLLPLAPARADFFDDARKTFESDIPHFFQNDVPHFFQDDVPCAFGGKPTSGTKSACKSGDPPKKATEKDHPPPPAEKPKSGGEASPSSGQ